MGLHCLALHLRIKSSFFKPTRKFKKPAPKSAAVRAGAASTRPTRPTTGALTRPLPRSKAAAQAAGPAQMSALEYYRLSDAKKAEVDLAMSKEPNPRRKVVDPETQPRISRRSHGSHFAAIGTHLRSWPEPYFTGASQGDHRYANLSVQTGWATLGAFASATSTKLITPTIEHPKYAAYVVDAPSTGFTTQHKWDHTEAILDLTIASEAGETARQNIAWKTDGAEESLGYLPPRDASGYYTAAFNATAVPPLIQKAYCQIEVQVTTPYNGSAAVRILSPSSNPDMLARHRHLSQYDVPTTVNYGLGASFIGCSTTPVIIGGGQEKTVTQLLESFATVDIVEPSATRVFVSHSIPDSWWLYGGNFDVLTAPNSQGIGASYNLAPRDNPIYALRNGLISITSSGAAPQVLVRVTCGWHVIVAPDDSATAISAAVTAFRRSCAPLRPNPIPSGDDLFVAITGIGSSVAEAHSSNPIPTHEMIIRPGGNKDPNLGAESMPGSLSSRMAGTGVMGAATRAGHAFKTGHYGLAVEEGLSMIPRMASNVVSAVATAARIGEALESMF